jgi:hypothetical protein
LGLFGKEEVGEDKRRSKHFFCDSNSKSVEEDKWVFQEEVFVMTRFFLGFGSIFFLVAGLSKSKAMTLVLFVSGVIVLSSIEINIK